jgi:hypothetical protein
MFDPDFYRNATNALRPDANGELHPLQPISDHIYENFGCHRRATQQLVEMILEKELPAPNRDKNILLTPGVVFTHVTHPGIIFAVLSIGSECEGTAFISNTDTQPFTNGPTRGSVFPSEFNPEECSVATKEEVEEFLKDVGLVK